ncbi:MAG: SEC-C metal-binding domain-containing protein [Polyangiales bacterium]
MTHAELIDRLRRSERQLPPKLFDALVAAGPAIVPELIAVVEGFEDDPSLAPVRAAEVLCEMRAPEAVDALLTTLVESDPLSVIHDRLIACLPKYGPSLLEKAWDQHERTDDDEARASLRAIMATLGVRDARLYDALLADLDVKPDRAAMHLSDYGDAAALPHLLATFDRITLSRDAAFPAGEFVELQGAIQDLGGSLSPAQQRKLDDALRVQRAMYAPLIDSLAEKRPPAIAKAKVGRNDPCPCGSGKKYKKCCLP